MEPPGAGHPGRAGPVAPLIPAPVRLGALAAATALAVTSRGDVVLLAVALGLAAADGVAAVGLAGALAGTALRWGSPSLRAIAGAQAVLAPAAWTGSASAVASAWCAAAAVVLASTACPPAGLAAGPDRLARALPFGLTAALILVGPGPGGALWLRALGAAAATVACMAMSTWRGRAVLGASAALGLAALAFGAVARPTGGWAPGLHAADSWEGAVIAVAAALIAVLGAEAVAERASRRGAVA